MKTLAPSTLAFLALLALFAAIPAAAQTDLVVAPPLNLVLDNYDIVPVGPYGGLEGSAFVARVGDPSAAWFNPAGLSRQETAQISGSAGVYQRTAVSPQALPNQGGSIQQLPNYVGFTFAPRTGMTVGAALLTTNSWTQETDAELITAITGGQQRFAYSGDSNFERRVGAVGVGYHPGGPWRYGAGLAFSMTDLRLVASASDRIADSAGLKSLLVSSRVSGSALQMRLQVGAQYDLPQFRFGAAMRTPGATLHRSGNVTLDGALDTGPGSQGASMFDPDAQFEYHLPWEFQGGAAFVHGRGEVEVDLQAYTPISAYSLISSTHPTLVYTDAGTNTPPTVSSQPFGGLTSASDGVVNVSAGGHILVWRDRTFRVHGSVGSNRSPVGSADMIFNKVDLISWTLGVSGSWEKFQFAAGFNRKSGTSNDMTFRNLLNGQVVHTSVDVRTTGFIYSLAYQF
jgi:hypothetical protein